MRLSPLTTQYVLATVPIGATDTVIAWTMLVVIVIVRLFLYASHRGERPTLKDGCSVLTSTVVILQGSIGMIALVGWLGLYVLRIVSPLWFVWEVAFVLSAALSWYVFPIIVPAIAWCAICRATTTGRLLALLSALLLVCEVVGFWAFEHG
jgi:hypothetical protein